MNKEMYNESTDFKNKYQILEKEFLSTNNIRILKKIIDLYIDVFLNEKLIDDHNIVDSTMIILSNYPSKELVDYLNEKIEYHHQMDLKKDLTEFIHMIKLHL